MTKNELLTPVVCTMKSTGVLSTHLKRYIRIEMKKLSSTKAAWQFILINVLIGLAVSLIFVDDFAFTAHWMRRFLIEYFLYSFLISCLLSGGINRLIIFSSRRISWLESPIKRLAFDFFVVVAYTFLVSLILTTFFAIYVWGFLTWATISWWGLIQSTLLPILIALGITIFYTSRSFLLEWKRAVVAAEQMKNEHLAGQYQGLKNQLNPHFLFNSLNVLSSLIYEDQDQANKFLEELAHIYRYVLDVQDERLVDLSRELAFSRSYLELQKLRFGEKLIYEIGIFDEADKMLPPLSLQLMLENCVKHNKASQKNPLHIHILEEDGYLLVRNNVDYRAHTEPKSGIGLQNIRKRLAYLTDKPLKVDSGNGNFIVGIPLIYNEI